MRVGNVRMRELAKTCETRKGELALSILPRMSLSLHVPATKASLLHRWIIKDGGERGDMHHPKTYCLHCTCSDH